jgi:hypothetical protein
MHIPLPEEEVRCWGALAESADRPGLDPRTVERYDRRIVYSGQRVRP